MKPTLTTALSALVLSLLGCTSTAFAQDYTAGPIRVSHPWAPPAPETAKDAPGYLTITNTGSAADRLVSGSFIEAAHLHVHTTSAGRGGSAMQAVDGLVINPGETVVLKPGGPHLMFVGPKGALASGQSFQSILRFERAGTVLVEFTVEGSAGKAARRGGGKPSEKNVQAQGR